MPETPRNVGEAARDDAQIASWERFFKKYYRQEAAAAAFTWPDTRSITIDWFDLNQHDAQLADQLLEHPVEALAAAEEATLALDLPTALGAERPRLHVRVVHLPDTACSEVRDLRSIHLGKLVSVGGLVRKATEVKPKVRDALFKCARCGALVAEPQEEHLVFKEPLECYGDQGGCGRDSTFKLVVGATRGRSSQFVDAQKIEVQESPELLRGGESPQRIEVWVEDDLCAAVRPGARVRINGVLRSAVKKHQGVKSTVFDVFLDAVSIESKADEYESIEITPEDEAKIKEASADPDLFGKFVSCIAPQIYGMQMEKAALLLQLFGGVTKELPDGGRLRGDSHILLAGDPSTGKSQLVRYMVNLAPRGIYTSGKSASGAGLTAAAVKEDDRWTVEAGAAVLADGGLLCVDELDKMNEGDRAGLHEVLESQSYHPTTEVTLAGGSRVQMGRLIDALFASKPDRIIQGEDCEILPVVGLSMPSADLLTGAPNMSAVTRVSRHKAPAKFVRVTYSNGRSVLVTPEHPVFIVGPEGLTVKPASSVRRGEWAPAPRSTLVGENVELVGVAGKRNANGREEKHITLPSTMTPELAFWLGLFASEGHSYKGSSHEIGISNTEAELLREAEALGSRLFGIEPSKTVKDQSRNGGTLPLTTLRWISTKLYRWMEVNFPEVVNRKAREKRIPAVVMASGADAVAAFLRGAFWGDGHANKKTGEVGISTASEGLAKDYADALLKLGLHARLHSWVNTYSPKGYGQRYWKVLLLSESRAGFYSGVVRPSDPKAAAVRAAVEMSQSKNKRHHDVLPTSVRSRIAKVMKRAGVAQSLARERRPEASYMHGMQVEVARRITSSLRSWAEQVANLKPNATIGEVQATTGWTGSHMARAADVGGSRVKYALVGGYDDEGRQRVAAEAARAARATAADVVAEMAAIDASMGFRYLRIEKVESVENEGELQCEWVYDVTVEPTHTFVAEGVLLHNTVSMAKAGLAGLILNARCSLLAAANPKNGRYDEFEPILEQIDMPPSLLSRFDLVFVIRDVSDPKRDKAMAEYVMRTHRAAGLERLSRAQEQKGAPFKRDFIRKYVAYAKRNYFPILTEVAGEKIAEYFTERRKAASSEGAGMPLTARQLEAFVRLSEASARVRLSETVEEEDVERALRLVGYSLQMVASTPDGKVDVDKMLSGVTKSMRDGMAAIKKIIKDHSNDSQHGVHVDTIRSEAAKLMIPEGAVDSLLSKLQNQRESPITETRVGYFRYIH